MMLEKVTQKKTVAEPVSCKTTVPPCEDWSCLINDLFVSIVSTRSIERSAKSSAPKHGKTSRKVLINATVREVFSIYLVKAQQRGGKSVRQIRRSEKPHVDLNVIRDKESLFIAVGVKGGAKIDRKNLPDLFRLFDAEALSENELALLIGMTESERLTSLIGGFSTKPGATRILGRPFARKQVLPQQEVEKVVFRPI